MQKIDVCLIGNGEYFPHQAAKSRPLKVYRNPLARFFYASDSNNNSKMKHLSKILLIDDDKDFGLILSYFFADKPFQFYVAHSLAEGMAMLEKIRPDHIFLDNGLPDGFGWEKTDFILDTYPLVQLNLLSALIVPINSTHTFRILEKPISTEKFMSCLAAA